MIKDTFGPAPVSDVEPGSPADVAGIHPGDMIHSIDGMPLRDAIDCYMLLADETRHELDIESAGVRLEVAVKPSGRPIGLAFSQPVFGPVITCNNRCMFCFVDQLPGGMRDTFYVKDDDYRLSFLSGNFITLTNLRQKHLRRIIEDRLSPLYVSLHSTESEIRRIMFGSRSADRALSVLDSLLAGGIALHLQIVLVRGVNDGGHLDITLSDIRSRYREAASVGVVPVGITTTGKQRFSNLLGYDSDSAAEVVKQIERWKPTFGGTGLFAADEFFFLAGGDPPPDSYYADYPQSENGIGLCRRFRDSLSGVAFNGAEDRAGSQGTVVITTPAGLWAMAPIGLERMGVEIAVCANSLFGERVTVCGLLPGHDVIDAIRNIPDAKRALVPETALTDNMFVDGVTVDDIERSSCVKIEVVPADARSLLEAVDHGWSDNR